MLEETVLYTAVRNTLNLRLLTILQIGYLSLNLILFYLRLIKQHRTLFKIERISRHLKMELTLQRQVLMHLLMV